MTHEPDPELEERLFELARNQASATERSAFLDDVCRGNPALRASLDELLRIHFGGIGFLNTPAEVDPRKESTGVDVRRSVGVVEEYAPFQRIGTYQLLEKIGEGGFGEVWLAQQREPVRRRVALKIIKPGMDSRQVVARFEAERQALALMDHPNIAKFLDAGTTEPVPVVPRVGPSSLGRPYFVMELVRGKRITEHCDDHQMSTAERVRLFILVCNAVQHAHQKGIIHRDLKPSNVLVTSQGGDPKVIDFGIAKAMQQELTDKTLFTQFSQFLGTPAYISPEQADVGVEDIDTRSDIYSLGVLLYELLVGRTPFNPSEMIKGGIDSLRRTIRERDPMRPSTRLVNLSDQDRLAAARHRQSEPERLIEEMKGDLDWIVLKCLEKDRARRYATANELVMDLQRYMDNEPVVARPPSTVYKVQKAWRRNRKLYVAAITTTVALVGATAVSLRQAANARSSRQIAEVSRKGAQELLYAANMSLIGKAWEANDLGRVRQLLQETATWEDRGFEWRYWQRQAHQHVRAFEGHEARVWCADFSPNGLRVVTASEDETAKVWDVETGKVVFTVSGHEDWVRSVDYSPDGRRIVTGSKDLVAYIWDAETGSEVLQLRGHRGALRSVAYARDGRRIVTASQDGTARIWDAETGRQLVVLRGHSNWLFSASFSPDGGSVVTAGDDATVRLWDAREGRETRQLKGHQGNVRMANFSPDGRQVITASMDRTAKIWDVETGRLRQTLAGHVQGVFSAAYSPDGRVVVTASGDQTARLWDVASGRELRQFLGHGSEIYHADFSRDGRFVLTASEDGTSRIWNTFGASAIQSLDYGAGVLTVAFSPDGHHVALGGEGGVLAVWEIATGARILQLEGHGGVLKSLAFSPDGRRIAAGYGDGMVRLWQVAGGRVVLSLPGHLGGVNSVAFSPDGRTVLSAGRDGRIKVRNVEDGHEVFSISPNQREAYSIDFSPDGTRIVGAFETAVSVWRADTGQGIWTLSNFPRTRSVRFSPDGEWILTSNRDKTARSRRATTGDPWLTLKGHHRVLHAAGYSPDGKRIVTASQDGTARVWEAESGRELLELRGHTNEVTSVTFSPDGQRVLTGSLDGTARLWAAASMKEIATWEQQAGIRSNHLGMALDEPRRKASPNRFSSGLVTRWLLLAPLPGGFEDITKALEVEQIQGEAGLQPAASDRALGSQQGPRWEPHVQTGSLLDLNTFVGAGVHRKSVAYAVSYLVLNSSRNDVSFKVSGDDECKVYLNGQLVHRSNPARRSVLDEETVEGLTLKAGTNTVVFKILNDAEYWRGSLRVLDGRGGEIPNLRVTLEASR